MEEMHITPEQFEVACLAGKHSASGLSFHQGLFQQVSLSEQFIFVICIVCRQKREKSLLLMNRSTNRFGRQMICEYLFA